MQANPPSSSPISHTLTPPVDGGCHRVSLRPGQTLVLDCDTAIPVLLVRQAGDLDIDFGESGSIRMVEGVAAASWTPVPVIAGRTGSVLPLDRVTAILASDVGDRRPAAGKDRDELVEDTVGSTRSPGLLFVVPFGEGAAVPAVLDKSGLQLGIPTISGVPTAELDEIEALSSLQTVTPLMSPGPSLTVPRPRPAPAPPKSASMAAAAMSAAETRQESTFDIDPTDVPPPCDLDDRCEAAPSPEVAPSVTPAMAVSGSMEGLIVIPRVSIAGEAMRVLVEGEAKGGPPAEDLASRSVDPEERGDQGAVGGRHIILPPADDMARGQDSAGRPEPSPDVPDPRNQEADYSSRLRDFVYGDADLHGHGGTHGRRIAAIRLSRRRRLRPVDEDNC